MLNNPSVEVLVDQAVKVFVGEVEGVWPMVMPMRRPGMSSEGGWMPPQMREREH